MKAITLPKYATFKMKLDGTVYDTEEIKRDYRQFADNLQEVLLSAAAIEVILKTLVAEYFVDDKSKKELFDHTVTLSNAFSFAEARRVVLEIWKKNGMPEKEHQELEKLLRKVMDYRNALAHGRTIKEGDKFLCRYFKVEHREDELNDAYWDEVQRVFHRTHELLMNIIKI